MWRLLQRLEKYNPSKPIASCSSMTVKTFNPPEMPNYYPGLLRLMR